MLEQPMMAKLSAMRLHGMLDLLEQQHKDPGSGRPSVLKRLALLVDHQWNWRQSQALVRRAGAGQKCAWGSDEGLAMGEEAAPPFPAPLFLPGGSGLCVAPDAVFEAWMVDEAEHLSHNQNESVASLRLLVGFVGIAALACPARLSAAVAN